MDLCGQISANDTTGEDDKAAQPDADIPILQAVLPITMDWFAGPGQVLGRWPGLDAFISRLSGRPSGRSRIVWGWRQMGS